MLICEFQMVSTIQLLTKKRGRKEQTDGESIPKSSNDQTGHLFLQSDTTDVSEIQARVLEKNDMWHLMR